MQEPPSIQAPAPAEEMKHSGLGIASFVVSVLVGVLMAGVFVIAAVLHGQGTGTAQYPGQTVVGLFVILLMLLDLVALGLGIASVVDRSRKRVFGILGLSFSGCILVGTIGLILLGLKMTGKF